MADAAECPGVEATGCVRAVDKPAVGSALDMGHKYLDVGLFLEPPSPFVAGAEAAEFCDDAETVDELEANDETDEDEFDRFAVFRGGISILDTSSALIEWKPLEAPLPDPHADLEMFCRFGGGATAVM
jgi:hypothetical protein